MARKRLDDGLSPGERYDLSAAGRKVRLLWRRKNRKRLNAARRERRRRVQGRR